MQKLDPCRARWIELGSPTNKVLGIDDLVADATYLSVVCSVETRPVIFDCAIDEDQLLVAFYALGVSAYERAWLLQMLSLQIEERASVMAAFEQFWVPRSGTCEYEMRAA